MLVCNTSYYERIPSLAHCSHRSLTTCVCLLLLMLLLLLLILLLIVCVSRRDVSFLWSRFRSSLLLTPSLAFPLSPYNSHITLFLVHDSCNLSWKRGQRKPSIPVLAEEKHWSPIFGYVSFGHCLCVRWERRMECQTYSKGVTNEVQGTWLFSSLSCLSNTHPIKNGRDQNLLGCTL